MTLVSHKPSQASQIAFDLINTANMYRINDQTLLTNGFIRRGVVGIVVLHRFVVSPEEVQGLVIYIMRVGSEYMKGGHTGKKSSSFVARMKSEFGCLVPVIAAGPPYVGDPWKRFVPLTLAVPGVIEFWVRRHQRRANA